MHVLVWMSYHPLDTRTTYNAVVIRFGIVAFEYNNLVLMESEPKYQDVSKFLRLDSAKWSIMQQIAGCAMPLVVCLQASHRKQKEINKQLTTKVNNDSCKKRFRNWKSCCSGFMLAFWGVLWIIPSNVYAVFFNQLSRGHLWPDEFTGISCTGCMAQISNDFSSWLLWPLPTSKFNKWLWRIMIQFTRQCAEMKHLSLFYLSHPPDTTAMSQLALSPKWAASCNSFAPIVAGDNCVTSGSMQRAFCADQTGQEQPWRIDVMIWPFPGLRKSVDFLHTPQTKI